MRETTIAATIVADMRQYLDAHGVASERALREAGVTAAFPPRPDERIPGSQLERLWAVSVRELHDPCAGLHMAEAYSPGTLDILGFVLLSCPTIGDMLDRLCRFVRVLNDGLRVTLVQGSAAAHVHCTFVEGVDNYLLRRPREAMDSLWGGLARELLRMTATPLVASEVSFAFPAPSASERHEYSRVFGCPVRFGADGYRFSMARAALDTPLRSANPALLEVFSRHADDVVTRLDRQHPQTHHVMTVVASRLKGKVPTLTEVARELAMSDRNLQRMLQANGTTYQKLVDELRRELALSHLRNPDTSAGQVGFLLGFSEPSAFHRAFRRWTGQAPSAYRRAASA